MALVQPPGKLGQMMAHGSRRYRVPGFGLDAGIFRRTFKRLAELCRRSDSPLEISDYRYNVTGMSGMERIIHEHRPVQLPTSPLQPDRLHPPGIVAAA
jgi:hypothetical protein